MRLIVLVAACLGCAGHSRRVQKPNFEQQVDDSDVPGLKTLTTLLLTSSLRYAFTPSGPGKQLLTANRNAGVKMQGQMDPIEVAQVELLQNQKKIGQLRGQLPQGSVSQVSQSIDKSEKILVQGGTLKTWPYHTSLIDRVQVGLSTDGRPLDADVHLWQGPDDTPCRMRVHSEDGTTHPFSAVIAIPGSGASTVGIYNTGQMEFPLAAYVTANDIDEPISNWRDTSAIVKGGALRNYEFDIAVQSVEIVIKTAGRPLNARIELLQGPNNNKQVIEIYNEDGLEFPFIAIIDTVGAGNVVRVVNTSPFEFPMFASVQPHRIHENVSPHDPTIGGGRL